MKRQSALFFFSKLLTAIISFFLVVLRSREFSAEELSDYYIVVKSINIIIALFVTWIPESCARFYQEIQDKKSFYSTYAFLLFFSSLLALGAIVVFAFIPGFTSISLFFPYVAMLIVTQALNDAISAPFRMAGKPGLYALSLVLSSVLNLVVFLLIPAAFGMGSIFIGMGVAYVLTAIIGFFVLRIYRYLSFRSFDKKLFCQSLRYALPLVVVWCSIWLFTSSDTFIISQFCPKEQISYYNLAEGVVTQSIGTITTAFSFAVFPAMIDQWGSSKKDELGKTVGAFLTFLLKYLIPAVFGLMCISFFVYGPILDDSYNPNYEGSILICIFALAQFFDVVFQTYAKIWNLEKRTITSAVVSMSSAVFNFFFSLLAVWLAKSYLWAAGITLLVIFLRMVVTRIMFGKRLRIVIDWKMVFCSVLSSGVMALCILPFLYYLGPHIWAIAVAVLLGVSVFSVSMMVLGQMRKEVSLLERIFKKQTHHEN